jgi:hypothetical protein
MSICSFRLKGRSEMKRHKAILSFAVIMIAAGAMLLSSGCDNSITDPDPATVVDTLSLPPQSSFIMTYGDFVDGPGSTRGDDRLPAIMAKDNWGYSFVNVTAWNTVLWVTMVVPTATFLRSFQFHPVLQPDGWWQWSYNVVADGSNHTVALKGKIVEDEVNWEMHVSRHGAWDDFIWFTGTHDPAATSGRWTIFTSPDEPTEEFLLIEWTRDPENNYSEIRYTMVDENLDEFGDFIHYGSRQPNPFDRFYHIFDYSEVNSTEIEWIYDTKEGRVRDTANFHDIEWHCWDHTLEDDPECDGSE